LSRSKLYKLVKEGKFPASVAIGEGSRAKGWAGSKIDEWVRRTIVAGAVLKSSRADARH
jgi:predicted DNA-binding transcriptional regulator AlpA